MNRVGGLTIVLIGIACVGTVSSLNCYLCNSYSDGDHTACVDPMSPYPQVNYTTCPDYYTCTRISYITQKQFVVSRGCDPAENTCQKLYDELVAYYPDVAAFVCSTCSTDLCNSGG